MRSPTSGSRLQRSSRYHGTGPRLPRATGPLQPIRASRYYGTGDSDPRACPAPAHSSEPTTRAGRLNPRLPHMPPKAAYGHAPNGYGEPPPHHRTEEAP
ncbi:hypothetical protein HEK131_30540 [Streptomyces seoulensis]|nr:hypothetical protein HEK131_30540 [Streptomyces seoulensis]